VKIRILHLLAISLFLPASASLVLAYGAGDLDSLETRFFQHTYPNQSMSERLDRLDQLVFGVARKGSDQERLTKIQSVLAGTTPSAPEPQTASAPAAREAAPIAEAPPEPARPSRAKGRQRPAAPKVAAQTPKEEESFTPMDDSDAGNVQPFTADRTPEPASSRSNQIASASPFRSQTPAAAPQSIGMLGVLEQLENRQFHHTFNGQPLPERVGRLEAALLPNNNSLRNAPLSVRVSRLAQAAAHPTVPNHPAPSAAITAKPAPQAPNVAAKHKTQPAAPAVATQHKPQLAPAGIPQYHQPSAPKVAQGRKGPNDPNYAPRLSQNSSAPPQAPARRAPGGRYGRSYTASSAPPSPYRPYPYRPAPSSYGRSNTQYNGQGQYSPQQYQAADQAPAYTAPASDYSQPSQPAPSGGKVKRFLKKVWDWF